MKPVVIIVGLVSGHNTHMLKMYNKLVSANKVQKGSKVDCIVYTWDIPFNNKFIKSLDRYKEYYNFTIHKEKYTDTFIPKLAETIKFTDIQQGHYKTFIIGYLLHRLVNDIDLTQYDYIIKYKVDIYNPNNHFPFGVKEDIEDMYTKIKQHCFPTLEQNTYKDCIYVNYLHEGIDERTFVTFPEVLNILFKGKDVTELFQEFIQICKNQYKKFEVNKKDLPVYRTQGTVMWYTFIKKYNIPIINSRCKYTGAAKGIITPQLVVKFKDNSYIIDNEHQYEYKTWNFSDIL
jgi:hypothetical protein